MENIDPHNFDQMISIKERALVLFYADWCPFCMGFRPIFESTRSPFELMGAKLNDDDNPLWDKFSIRAVPTIIAFKKGKVLARKDSRLSIGLKKSDVDSILMKLEKY